MPSLTNHFFVTEILFFPLELSTHYSGSISSTLDQTVIVCLIAKDNIQDKLLVANCMLMSFLTIPFSYSTTNLLHPINENIIDLLFSNKANYSLDTTGTSYNLRVKLT